MTIHRGYFMGRSRYVFTSICFRVEVRPVIVVGNNKANTYSSVITVVPDIRIYKRYLPTHVFIINMI